VRTSADGIGEIFDRVRRIAERVRFEKVTTEVGAHPKVRLRATSEQGRSLNVKIEINTAERPGDRMLPRLPFVVASNWFAGQADMVAGRVTWVRM
jgi:hypothetical protein